MDPIGGLPIGGLRLGDERGVYRQRVAPSRLKSTARRLVKRRVGRRDNAQAFKASRCSTTLRSPRTLIVFCRIADHIYQNSRELARLSNADIESMLITVCDHTTALFSKACLQPVAHRSDREEIALYRPAIQFPRADAVLRRPVDPTSMRDFMVFEQHAAPTWRAAGLDRGPEAWYERPLGYFSSVATLRGPRDQIEVPGGSSELDFELEIGAVIRREARSVTPEAAAGLIAGYLILCDWSARDLQGR